MSKFKINYDLEKRTSEFGKNIIRFCKEIPHNTITQPLIRQLIKAGTSIGANYREANAGSSKRDFRNKIFLCKKESQETQHWLEMMTEAEPHSKDKARKLWQEAKEFILIFGKIISTLDGRNSKFKINSKF